METIGIIGFILGLYKGSLGVYNIQDLVWQIFDTRGAWDSYNVSMEGLRGNGGMDLSRSPRNSVYHAADGEAPERH